MKTLIKLLLLAIAAGLASSRHSKSILTVVRNYQESATLCSSECTDGISNAVVDFLDNRKHGYLFSGKTIIAPTGTEEGKSEVSIRGKANIIGTQKCGAILYLKNLEITQGSKTYGHAELKELEGHPILFSYNNGKVGRNICSLAKDSVASMNLKRAIISSLQVSSIQDEQKEFFETDIQGTCNTTYYPESWTDSYLTITKEKDLTKCTGHDKINLMGLSSAQSYPIYEDSPFSTAVQRSEIQIKDSLLVSATNEETFIYQPFGPIDVATKITVSMSLKFMKLTPIQTPSASRLTKSRTIMFEKPTGIIGSADADALVAATHLALTKLEPIVDIDGADSFSMLVQLFKVAKKDDILSAFDQIMSGSTEYENTEVPESIFIDALMAANSGESIEAAVEIIESNKLSDSLTIAWFNNLANAKNPTKEAVVKASSLLNGRAIKEGYLGVGALLRQYLLETQDYTCPEVESTLNNLGNPLKKVGHGPLSSNDEDLIIASLKGLGYAHYINSDLEELVIKITMDKNTIQRIRAAALNIFKIYAKNSKVKKACKSIFTDFSEDSELRILAFKVFAINPSNKKAAVIKKVLDDKNTQLQIRAYLLSYLSNLQTTVDEAKLDQKRFYEGIKMISSKKSLNDILRYSRNLEYYHQCPLLHSGVLLDADVIYSYQTFLARSSSASLKAFIFGRKHDVFDVDVRIENLEPLLEKLFGPEGYFAKSNGSTFDEVKNYITQAINYANNREQNAVDSESSSKQENMPEEEMKKMYVDIALKLFGNDLGWFSLQGCESKITYQHIIDAILNNFGNSVTDEKNIELNIRKQIPIIDFEKKYATCSGLPVSLKIQATAAIKVDIATMFDLDSYFKHPENSNFALKLIPSGSIVFNSLLTIDGCTVDVGYKISSSLHTSTGSEFSLNTTQDRGFEMIYGLPLDAMDILTIKSEAFSIVREKGSESIKIPLSSKDIDRHSYTRAFENVNSTGLSFYVDYDFPWNGELKSLLPFSGPSSLSLKILKVDEKLTKYVVKGNYDFKSKTLKYIKFIFVTPNAEIKRGLELVVIYDTKAHKKILAEFITPFTKKIIQGTLVDSDEQKTIEVKYIDGSQHIFSAGVKCEEVDAETMKYSPIFEAKYSTEVSTKHHRHHLVPNFDIEGNILVKRNKNSESNYPSKLTLRDIAIVTPESKHSLQGSLTFENNEVLGDVSLIANEVTINVNGLLSGDNPIFKLDLKLNMTRTEQAKQQLLENDESNDKPMSKFVALLYKVKTLNALISQELHIEAPYVFLSKNHIYWDDDYFEANCDVLYENSELTTHGYIMTTNLLDTAFNANITILPSTEDTGKFVLGLLEHSLVSDPSNAGHGDFKYIQNKNKKGGYFEFNSEDPKTFGRYHFNTEHQSTDDAFKFTIYHDIYDGSTFTVDMNILTDDINCTVNFDSPNPEYKSFMTVHGWSDTKNTYLFDTQVLWPGDENSNYLNANGKMLLNGRHIHMISTIDFPLAQLENFHISVKSKPNPEIEDGGFVTVRCISNEKVLLSEKFAYTLTLINGELHVSGESIYDESQNVKPISFEIVYKNFTDEGKQIAYKIELEHNNQQIIYQRLLQVSKYEFNYRQLHKIDDEEQKIMMDLSYDIISAWDWSYKLVSRVDSPNVFHYLINDDQNLLEFNSYIKFGNYSLNEDHSLKIYSSEGLTDSYEMKWLTNHEKTAFQLLNKQREIRGLVHYGLNSIEGGYNFTYSVRLWLDFNTDPNVPNSESTLNISAYYSLNDGLSTASDIKICVPLFDDKEMGVKTDIQMFQNWENPLNVQLELDIFPNTNQTLKLRSSLNRDVQDSGVLYSALLLAESDGMKLDYELKDSLYVSSEKWGKYLDARFIDTNNTIIPLQIHFELLPRGFTNKMNIFDVAVIDVDSSILVKDGILNTRSNIKYNDHPYSFEISLTSNPSFKFIMGWQDKTGSHEQLMVEGSIVMDDSAVISATRIQNDGNDVFDVGSITKSLDEENWWQTRNHLSTEQTNEIWQSLKGQLIEIFISVHSNMRNITAVAKQQRKVRLHEARRAHPQYRALMEYSRDMFNQILDEIVEDDYILQVPKLIQNTTEAVFCDVIEFMNSNSEYFISSARHLNGHMRNNLNKIYKYYSNHGKVLLNKLKYYIDELINQAELSLLDVFRLLNLYTDEPVNDMESSEPRSVKEYYNKVMDKFMKAIEKLEDTINNIKEVTEDYIKRSPLYDTLHDQIEKLKSYPYKEKVWQEIHNYLQDLENSAPTRDFSSFINALDKYINNIIHDKPVNQRDITTLRYKGLIVLKSMIFDFSNYVDHDRAMKMYNALRKLTTFGQTVLHIASPNTFQYPTTDNPLLADFNVYYNKYLNPSSLIPPFDVQSVIIDSVNIITYNDQPYCFMPNTGYYTLAEDFVNNKFSILAGYKNNILTKISISIYNGENYVLVSGGSITVNGKDTDFPLINDNLKTWRDVYFFGIDVAVGVSIKSTLDLSIVQVYINGYFYGHVRGLLGSMNQEPKFDMKLPNGELPDDMASFLLAYRQTGNTEPTNIDLLQTNDPLCSSLFSGKSSLKPFFSTMPPTAYRAICNQIVSTATSEEDSLNKACLVAKSFVSMARQNHMSSCNIPDMCITTSVHQRTIDATTNVQISDAKDVADIMILFEEVVEIEQTFSLMLNPFIKQVTSNFNSKGINDVKFILIGYSGKTTDSEVHMYATNEDDGYTKLLSTLPEWTESQTTADTSILQSQQMHSLRKVMGKNSKDKAYKLSADYPFRANAVKVVLSIAKSLYSTEESMFSVSQYTFNYVTASYMKQGIAFYLIAPINLNDASDDGIFGASGVNTIYTNTSPNGKYSDDAYTYDKSMETNLVLETSGTMYDSRFFIDTSKAHLNTFLRSLSKTVVGMSVSDTPIPMSCSSSLYNGVMPYAKCVLVTS